MKFEEIFYIDLIIIVGKNPGIEAIGPTHRTPSYEPLFPIKRYSLTRKSVTV